MIKVFAVIDKLLELLQSWVARQNQKKAQDERDALENDPYLWFDSHFNGVPESARQKPNPNEAHIKDTA